ncbi:hypothetical protein [Paraburkholderia heleia]|uniref:hypothetical protein n=1 Tax=Paraburkholderia heleia TaxID=634127 RepID=UPI002AB7D6FB|nr:hypothetical protein [Paraburkholderia heleia]
MGQSYVMSTGLPARLTIHEAADLVAKETGKPADHAISFLVDCAEQGYFSADLVPNVDSVNVSHISRIDPSKSTVSSVDVIEWLNTEIEGAHQRAREAIAAKESEKWGYPVDPATLRVNLTISWSDELDGISRDDTVSMTTRNWIEYLAREMAERQGWTGAEREAKCAVARAEYLNLFFALASTLPLVQELTRAPWNGAQLPSDWLTNLHLVRADLRDWAKSHAPEVAQSRILAERSADSDPQNNANESVAPALRQSVPAIPDVSSLTWVSQAREIALEYIDRHALQDLHPSQDNVAEHVAKECRTRKVFGPRGPMSASTIKREAIQGDWWRENNPVKRLGKLGKPGQ